MLILLENTNLSLFCQERVNSNFDNFFFFLREWGSAVTISLSTGILSFTYSGSCFPFVVVVVVVVLFCFVFLFFGVFLFLFLFFVLFWFLFWFLF